MHELKTGLNADKFATFWMFPITHSFSSVNDPCTLYNQLNASRLARFPKTGKQVNFIGVKPSVELFNFKGYFHENSD